MPKITKLRTVSFIVTLKLEPGVSIAEAREVIRRAIYTCEEQQVNGPTPLDTGGMTIRV